MQPLIALIGVASATYLILRFLGRPRAAELALRSGVFTMFMMTGVAHFIGLKADLVKMVPAWVPAPSAVVALTGALELLGALGMVRRWSSVPAAAGLTALLACVFPANVHWALSAHHVASYDRIVPRTAMQVVFLAATVGVLQLSRRPTDAHPAAIGREQVAHHTFTPGRARPIGESCAGANEH